MTSVLILGVSGFSGKYLYKYLKNIPYVKLFGTYSNSKIVSTLDCFAQDINLLKCDIRNYEEITEVLRLSKPDQIYYLSSLVTVANSEELALNIYNVNVLGAFNFYEAVKRNCKKAKIVAIGSAEEYGMVKEDELPISESTPLNPKSSYGLSKKISEEIGLYYSQIYEMDVRFTRTFHFSGPMQPPTFVISDFAKQIVEIEEGNRDKILVGNLEAKRDFTDIRDSVKAYYLIMERGQAKKVYNVCSGTSHKISDILNLLILKSEKDILVEVYSKKIRQFDIPDFKGDNSELLNTIGWKPDYSLNNTIEDVLKYWRDKRT